MIVLPLVRLHIGLHYARLYLSHEAKLVCENKNSETLLVYVMSMIMVNIAVDSCPTTLFSNIFMLPLLGNSNTLLLKKQAWSVERETSSWSLQYMHSLNFLGHSQESLEQGNPVGADGGPGNRSRTAVSTYLAGLREHGHCWHALT